MIYPSQEELRERFNYDEHVGILTYRKKVFKSTVNIGDEAGYKTKRGYINIQINLKYYLAHRLIWLYVYGKIPNNSIDHINHDTSDNRLINLREADIVINGRNRTLGKNNTSGHIGVILRPKNKFEASIKVLGKTINLGLFKNIDEAIYARKKAEIKYKFHSNHGLTRNDDVNSK